MIGQLIWNHDRPDIAFDTGALYGGLHCGDCFNAGWTSGGSMSALNMPTTGY